MSEPKNPPEKNNMYRICEYVNWQALPHTNKVMFELIFRSVTAAKLHTDNNNK